MATGGSADALDAKPKENEPKGLWKSKKNLWRKFTIPWPNSNKLTMYNGLKWKLSSKDESNLPSKEELDETLPILKLDNTKVCDPKDGIQVTWIGHATMLVQMEKVNILTDPIFSSRAAPLALNMWPISTRFREASCSVEELPNIDAVVISHDHYDHLDHQSVIDLNKKCPDIHWFVPLGLKSWMRSTGCKSVVELDWWEEKELSGHPDVKLAFTPAQHWCQRGVFDRNKVLCGSWCIIGKSNRFFFGGDTGYFQEIFQQIGERYGPFNCAGIPIGAYEPRWLMYFQHVNPEEAVKIHQDIKCAKSIGIHWGTFNLTNEFYLEPRDKLAEALKKDPKLRADEFVTVKHGETISVGN